MCSSQQFWRVGKSHAIKKQTYMQQKNKQNFKVSGQAVMMYILLAQKFPQRRIDNFKQQVPQLAKFCKSPIPEFIACIKQLKHHDILAMEDEKHLIIHGEEAFEKWGFDMTERTPGSVNYDPNDDKTLEDLSIDLLKASGKTA
jgi:hypothetical protein